MKNYQWQDGDIIKMYLMDGREQTRVILKTHNAYATTLVLFPDESKENDYTVRAKDLMHVDTGRVMYTSSRDLEAASLVRSLKADELEDLLEEVGRTMQIPVIQPAQQKDVNADLEKENKDLQEKIALVCKEKDEIEQKYKEEAAQHTELKNKLSRLKPAGHTNLDIALAKAETERDIYKELYFYTIGRIGDVDVKREKAV